MTLQPKERRRLLLELVREATELSVAELTRRLEANGPTVRRDLRMLEAQGFVRRAYGTVTAVESSRHETDLAWRALTKSDEKSAIASAAVEAIEDAVSIFIDEGHLPRLVAQHLPSDRRLTVVTSSLPVAAQLAERSNHEVILLGGRVRGRTLGTVDHWARDMLAGLVLDLAFLGANGVTLETGLTTPDPAVAAVKAKAVEVSKRRIFIGDHTKFGVTSFARFASISDIELFITSDRLSPTAARRFAQAGAELVRV